MIAKLETGWVKPPSETGGLDHLGVQAPCIQIYGQLLPGITNVTDRARYYSFYLWLFSEFEKKGWRSREKVVTELRKADCLFSMIAIRHAQLHGDTSLHAGSSVGSNTLTQTISQLGECSSSTLSNFTHLEDGKGNRYFKNPFGGLGQYYFGVLDELHLMTGNSVANARLINRTGEIIAKAMSIGVDAELFMKILEQDTVNQALLDQLSSFCHCQLTESQQENALLISLMRDGWTSLLNSKDDVDTVDTSASMARSKSLAIMMKLADKCAEEASAFDVLAFRGMSYAMADGSGQTIEYSNGLIGIARNWQVYQRNEALAVAVQGLFTAILRAADLQTEPFENTRSMCQWFWREGPGELVLKNTRNMSLVQFLQDRCGQLPAINDWQHEEHEIQLCEQIVSATHQAPLKVMSLSVIVSQCLDILAAICFREENTSGYDAVQFRQGYLDPYPVNLNSVPEAVRGSLSKETLLEALVIFSTHFCLDGHIRVAMRKLRQQGKNTSRFENTENGIVIKAVPPATHTSPRFAQARRILLDMGLLVAEGDLSKTSAEGLAFVEAVS